MTTLWPVLVTYLTNFAFKRLAMRARGIALISARSRSRKLVTPGTGITRHMEAGVVVHPVDQSVLEHRIGARDALRDGQRVAVFPRCVRVRNVDGPQPVAVPRGEDQVLEHGRVVVLLRHAAAQLTVRLGDRLIE